MIFDYMQAQALLDRIANLTTKNQKNYKIHIVPDCFRVGSPLCDNFLSKKTGTKPVFPHVLASLITLD